MVHSLLHSLSKIGPMFVGIGALQDLLSLGLNRYLHLATDKV